MLKIQKSYFIHSILILKRMTNFPSCNIGKNRKITSENIASFIKKFIFPTKNTEQAIFEIKNKDKRHSMVFFSY